MKDFVNKLTFSFLMAQLFPGAVAVFAVGFTYTTWKAPYRGSALATAQSVLEAWAKATVPQQILMIALFIATGMFIHGLHWATLGAQESKRSVYEDTFHQNTLLWLQVLGGPFRLLRECAHLFFTKRDLREVRMDENVTRIDKDHMEQFDFVEEFYLASGQFFMHVSYALAVMTLSVLSFILAYGAHWQRVMLLLLAYLFTGVFFLLGRIQLCSLFRAEEELAKKNHHERFQKLKDRLQSKEITQEQYNQERQEILDAVCS